MGVNVVVCVKHVPDTEAQVRLRPDGRGIEESGLNFVLNYYDEHGVEEALRIKERFGGTVTLVTAGPPRAVEGLRAGLAMGGDAAVHIQDQALAGLDHIGIAFFDEPSESYKRVSLGFFDVVGIDDD